MASTSFHRSAWLILLGLSLLALTAAARGAAVLPDFSQATFTPGAAIDNPYFPLVPGTTLRYSADLLDRMSRARARPWSWRTSSPSRPKR